MENRKRKVNIARVGNCPDITILNTLFGQGQVGGGGLGSQGCQGGQACQEGQGGQGQGA